MSNPNMVQFCLNLVTTFLILQGVLLPSGFFVSCQNINFTFPSFNNTDPLDPRFIILGDVISQNSSMQVNSYDYSNKKSFSVGKFLYPDMVRMRDPSTNQVASFSTSFSFEIALSPVPNPARDPDGRYMVSDGFAFTFATDNSTIVPSGAYHFGEILCVNKTVSTTRLFAVEVDTWLGTDDFDPSDSHIGVDVNSVIHNNGYTSPEFVHNLCQPPYNTSFCGYFVNHPGPFTVWVDYDGTTHGIDVRFSPGMNASKLAVAPIIHTELDLSKVLNEFMYVGFSGSFGIYGEVHRILSWNFSSSGLSMSTAPPPPALSPAPCPQAGWSSSNVSLNIAAVIGIVSILGACVFIILLGVFVFCYCRRQRKNQGGDSTLKLHLLGPRIFTYQELSKATKDFNKSELLGSGGFGAVYRGCLHPSGAMVAVKRCTTPEKAHAEEGFVAEATSISQIRHRNLVQGWCQDKGQLLLVYDYMPNGSLDEWLFKNATEVVLTWALRYNILAGVAAALAYLHEDWQQCVLHRDIKSSNVLLDSQFNAHLGNFGLARLIDHHKAEKTTLMAGTLGYMVPEMYYMGKASKESDVYSFGVLILEVVCGRKPLNPEEMVLVEQVWRAHEAGELLRVVDPRLGSCDHTGRLSLCVPKIAVEEGLGRVSWKVNSVEDVLRLGLLCCQLNPSKRPSMGLVKHVFQTGDGAKLPPLPATKTPMPGYSSVDSGGF